MLHKLLLCSNSSTLCIVPEFELPEYERSSRAYSGTRSFCSQSSPKNRYDYTLPVQKPFFVMLTYCDARKNLTVQSNRINGPRFKHRNFTSSIFIRQGIFGALVIFILVVFGAIALALGSNPEETSKPVFSGMISKFVFQQN